MSWTKTLNTKGQYFRKFIQSLKSNTGSVCRNNKNSCHRNSWSLLGTLCFWSHDFTFLSTIIEWELLIGKKQRAGINIISDIEKLLKWLPVIYTRNKNQWMGWSNRPYSNSKKKLHWKCLVEKGNSGKFCRKSRICSTPNCMVLHAFTMLASARGLCLARRLYTSPKNTNLTKKNW